MLKIDTVKNLFITDKKTTYTTDEILSIISSLEPQRVIFEQIMTQDEISYILDNNDVSFSEGYTKDEIEMNFHEVDNKGDTVTHATITYNTKTLKLTIENSVSDEEKEFDTISDLRSYNASLEDAIYENGCNPIEF